MSDDMIEQVDELIAASQQFEQKLTEAGFSQAHEWLFNVREILYDLQRMNKRLATLFNTPDVDKAPLLLDNFTEDFLYTVLPHVQHHLDELEEQMERLLPASEVSESL